MRNILIKEFRLSASPLSFFFILFGLMFFIPGYPILLGAFFVTLGLFYSFQATRETNDILYSALLPIAKRDVVKGKYAFVCSVEGISFLLMAAVVIVRMTLLKDSPVYRNNALMNANLFALGGALLIFGLFNLIFLSGFFKTAYKIGRPFVIYIVVVLFTVIAFEALHHFPGLEAINAFGTDSMTLQLLLLLAGALLCVIMTVLSCGTACSRFEKLDL